MKNNNFISVLAKCIFCLPLLFYPIPDSYAKNNGVDISQRQLLKAISDSRSYVKNKQYREAVVLLERVTKLAPDNVEVLYILGQAYEGAGIYDRALPYLKKAAELSPDVIQLQRDYARISQLNGDFDKSVSILTELKEQEVKRSLRKSILSDIEKVNIRRAIHNKDFYKAITAIQNSSLLFPDDAEFNEMLGEVYADVELMEDAEHSYYLARDKAVDKSAVDVKLSKLYQKNEESKKQREVLSRILTENKKGSNYQYALSALLGNVKRNIASADYAIALSDSKLILDKVPYQLDASKLLSSIYIAQKDYKSAKETLVELKDKFPKEVDLRMSLANLYLDTGEDGKAEKQYEEIAKLDKKGVFGQESRGKLTFLRAQKIKQLPDDLSADGKIDAILEEIDRWIKDGDFDSAESYLKSLLMEEPKNGRANFLLGKLYSKQSKIESAKKYLTRSIFYMPSEVEFYFYYAEYTEKLGDLSTATQLYRDILNNTSDSREREKALASIDFLSGEQLVRQGSLEEALSHFRTMLEKRPDEKKVLIKMAVILNMLGRSEEARQVTAKLSELNRSDITEDEQISQVKNAINKKDISTASTILSNMLKKTPNSSKANYWAGYIFKIQNKIKEAIPHIEKSTEFSPENRKLKLFLAKLYTSNNELDKAKEIYDELLTSPVDVAEKLNLELLDGLAQGQQYLNAQSYDEALFHFKKLKKQFPRNIKVLEGLATIYSEQSKTDLLKLAYLDMINSDPTYVSAYGRLSGIYLKENDEKNWRESLRNVIRYSESGVVLKKKAIEEILRIAGKYISEGKHREAQIELDAILSLEPQNINANLLKAEMYHSRQQDDLAEETYLSILASHPLNHEARRKLASFYVKQDRLDEAIVEYEKISKVAANDIVVQEALASLRKVSEIKAANISMELSKDSNVNEVLDAVKGWIRSNQINTAYEVLIELVEFFPENAQVHYWLGTVYEKRKQPGLALQHIGESVELSPKNPRLRTAFGSALLRSNNIDESINQYNIVIETGGDTAFTKETKKLLGFAIGQKFIYASQFEEALAHYLEMSEEYPNDLKVLGQLGSVNFQLKNFNTAENIFSKILDLQPQNVSIHMQLALVYREKGQLEDYNNQLKQVILIDPDGFGLRAANQLGLADGNRYLAQKEWVKAIKSFQKVLKSDKKNVHAHIGISRALFEAGDHKRAEQLLTNILNENPTNTTLRLELAKLFVRTNRIQPATKALERIIYVDGDSAVGREAKANLTNIYRLKAETLGKSGDISGAVREYLKAVNRDPRDIKAHLALADIYRRSQRYTNNAIAHYKESLKVDPYNFQVHMNLGTLFERLRQYDEAMNAFSQAIATMKRPSARLATKLMISVRMQVAKLQFVEKNYAWVVDELKELLTYEPSSSPVNVFLSSVYAAQGEFESAIVALRKVLEVSPSNWDIRYRLAILYERTSEDELALAQYRTIVRANVAGNLVEQARDRIPALEDRVRNFNYSLTYSLSNGRTIYPNTQLASNSFNSSLRFDFTTRYRPTKDVNISFRISPTYSALHESQNDSLSPEYGITSQYNTSSLFFTATASFREIKGLLLEDFRGRESNISLITAKRLDTPLIPTGDDRSRPQTIQYQLSLRNFSSEDLSFSSTREVSPAISFIYPLKTGGSVTANYSFTDTQNTDQFGDDYANYAYNMRISVRALIAMKLSASFSSGLKYQKFKNLDSQELYANDVSQRRENGQFSVSASLNYQFHRRLSLFASVSAVESRSNVNGGERNLIYWTKNVPVGFQNSTLTDYRALNFSSGVSFRF